MENYWKVVGSHSKLAELEELPFVHSIIILRWPPTQHSSLEDRLSVGVGRLNVNVHRLAVF